MAEIYFTKEHEWIKVEDNVGVVGITAYASEQLGDEGKGKIVDWLSNKADALDLTVFGPNVPQWKFFGVVGFVISIIMILG